MSNFSDADSFSLETSEWGNSESTDWENSDTLLGWVSTPWKFTIPEVLQLKKKTRPDSNTVHLEDEMFESGVRVFFSCPEAWDLLMSTKPAALAIDCEGTHNLSHQHGYPIMIQISSPDYVILEFPTDYKDLEGFPSLSEQLRKVIDDNTIIKIVFDPTGNDIACLNRPCSPVSDIQDLLKRSNLGIGDECSKS